MSIYDPQGDVNHDNFLPSMIPSTGGGGLSGTGGNPDTLSAATGTVTPRAVTPISGTSNNPSPTPAAPAQAQPSSTGINDMTAPAATPGGSSGAGNAGNGAMMGNSLPTTPPSMFTPPTGGGLTGQGGGSALTFADGGPTDQAGDDDPDPSNAQGDPNGDLIDHLLQYGRQKYGLTSGDSSDSGAPLSTNIEDRRNEDSGEGDDIFQPTGGNKQMPASGAAAFNIQHQDNGAPAATYGQAWNKVQDKLGSVMGFDDGGAVPEEAEATMPAPDQSGGSQIGGNTFGGNTFGGNTFGGDQYGAAGNQFGGGQFGANAPPAAPGQHPVPFSSQAFNNSALGKVWAYLSGNDAMPDQQVKQLENSVDPDGTMDRGDRVMSAIEQAYKTGGEAAGWAAMQNYQKKQGAFRGAAAGALNQGGDQAAAAYATAAMDYLPDGLKYNFAAGPHQQFNVQVSKNGTPLTNFQLNAFKMNDFLRNHAHWDTLLENGVAPELQKAAAGPGMPLDNGQNGTAGGAAAPSPGNGPANPSPGAGGGGNRGEPGNTRQMLEAQMTPQAIQERARRIFPYASQTPQREQWIEQQLQGSYKQVAPYGIATVKAQAQVEAQRQRGAVAAGLNSNAKVTAAAMNDDNLKAMLKMRLDQMTASAANKNQMAFLGKVVDNLGRGGLTPDQAAAYFDRAGVDLPSMVQQTQGAQPQQPLPPLPPPQQQQQQQSGPPPNQQLPRINSKAEADALAPGTWFLGPDNVPHMRPFMQGAPGNR